MGLPKTKICVPGTAREPNPPTVNTNRVAQLAIDTALPICMPCPVAKARRRRHRH